EIANATPGVYHAIVSGTTITSGASQRYVLIANGPLGAPPVCTDANEPNDTTATATTLASGVARSGRICAQNDIDFFKFESAGAGGGGRGRTRCGRKRLPPGALRRRLQRARRERWRRQPDRRSCVWSPQRQSDRTADTRSPPPSRQ